MIKQKPGYKSTLGRNGPGVVKIEQWLGYHYSTIDGTHIDPQTNECHASTPSGRVLMHPGDFIITLDSGAHYVVLGEFFSMDEETKADLAYIRNYARNQVNHLDTKYREEKLTTQEISNVTIFQRILELAEGIIARHCS